MKKITAPLCILLCMVLFLSARTTNDSSVSSQESPQLTKLPSPQRDGSPFGVDVNINMTTIDNWLERPDVAYFDMRMLYDPADFCAIGQASNLTKTLPGFRIVPFPLVASLGVMPVDGAYDGNKLFNVVWGATLGEILEVTPNYLESKTILDDIFPKDKAIFLMCGGAGYAALARSLLIHMGWDKNLIYHVGGNWFYEGNKSISLTISNDNPPRIATWRANYVFIDFEHLKPVRK